MKLIHKTILIMLLVCYLKELHIILYYFISIEYSSHWWEYDLKTFDLVEEFNSKKTKNEHVTATGGDTLGSLKWGAQIVELSKEFAEFVIGKIPAIQIDENRK